MATPTNKVKKPAKPAKPRSFYFVYKGVLEGEPTVTFDKDEAMETLIKAMEAGDTAFKMKKITLPKSSRPRNPVAQLGNAPA